MKIFDFLRPAAQRQRTEAKPEQNDAILARLTDTDPVYRALLDHAYSLAEQATMNAIAPKLTAEDRAYQCGQASALVSFIATVEDTRTRARALQQKRQHAHGPQE